jgi:hypothetical protein
MPRPQSEMVLAKTNQCNIYLLLHQYSFYSYLMTLGKILKESQQISLRFDKIM